MLGVSRFSIYWKVKEGKVLRMYKKKEDCVVLEEIKHVLKRRKSYGYKRVTALVNKERLKKGLSLVNKKRVYRIMKINYLLLAKSQVRRVNEGEKTGKIITLSSNKRWCSDCFEIECFNGEKVYVSFCAGLP